MTDIQVTNGAPVLAVTDFEASMRFYTEGLGFRVEARFDDPSFAILRHGPMTVCLAEQGHPSEDLPDHVMTVPDKPARPGVRLVLWVDDAFAGPCRAARARIPMASEPWSPPWGGGRFFARDPDGYLVEFETLA